MNNGKQSEQLLKVLGGHSASLDRTSKCRGLSEQPLYSGGHKAMQHETRNWNNFDKCEPEQQYRLGTVSYKITGGLKPVLQVPNLTLRFYRYLTLSLVSLLWDIGKQNSPRCDAAERGVPSGAILFA